MSKLIFPYYYSDIIARTASSLYNGWESSEELEKQAMRQSHYYPYNQDFIDVILIILGRDPGNLISRKQEKLNYIEELLTIHIRKNNK